MMKISQEDRMFLISHGVDISLPLCQNDLRGVLEVVADALVDNLVSHNDEGDEVGVELKKIFDRVKYDNLKKK